MEKPRASLSRPKKLTSYLLNVAGQTDNTIVKQLTRSKRFVRFAVERG
ncbi:hypothetical protein [Hymenobacter busanensis]|nr:hypothetical protein [Hymenobacter busanensis]